jgi:hypothetical protein
MILQSIRRRPSSLALHIVTATPLFFRLYPDPAQPIAASSTLNLISRDQVACAVDSRSFVFHAMTRVNKNFPLALVYREENCC